MRHRWTNLSLMPEETFDIPAILQQQSIGIVFRVTLKEDEKTLSLLHECIDFPILASPENVITGRLEFILAQIVPPGVRDTKALRRSGGQKVPTNPQALENSESLLRKAATPDTVHVKDRRMRGEAGPDSGRRILRSPIEEPCQFRPVGFILEIRRTRLCACHDEAIGRAAPEFVNQPIDRHDLVRVQEEQREHSPLLRAAERQGRPVRSDLKRAQDTEIEPVRGSTVARKRTVNNLGEVRG